MIGADVRMFRVRASVGIRSSIRIILLVTSAHPHFTSSPGVELYNYSRHLGQTRTYLLSDSASTTNNGNQGSY